MKTTTEKTVNLSEITKLRDQFEASVIRMDREIAALEGRAQQLRAERVATAGAVAALDKILADQNPPPAPDAAGKKS